MPLIKVAMTPPPMKNASTVSKSPAINKNKIRIISFPSYLNNSWYFLKYESLKKSDLTLLMIRWGLLDFLH